MASSSPTAATPVTVPASRPTPHSCPASLPTFSGVDTHTPVSSNCELVISSAKASPPTLQVPTCATRMAMRVSVPQTLETFLDTSPQFPERRPDPHVRPTGAERENLVRLCEIPDFAAERF